MENILMQDREGWFWGRKKVSGEGLVASNRILATSHSPLATSPSRIIYNMKITQTEIYKFSIPMHPFTIATGTMNYAQNIFIRIHTDAGYYGVGECSAFPMIVGETQATCFEMAKDFAALWKGKEALDIAARMDELHAFTAYNATIKSA